MENRKERSNPPISRGEPVVSSEMLRLPHDIQGPTGLLFVLMDSQGRLCSEGNEIVPSVKLKID